MSVSGSGYFLGTVENYFEGAGDGSSGANSFTLGAPVTFNLIYESDNIINQYQTLLKTYTDA